MVAACSLVPGGSGKNYSGYEEYLTKEKHYEKFTDVTELNKAISESAYFWTLNETKYSTALYTGKNVMINFLNSERVTFNYTDKHSVDVQLKNGKLTFEIPEVYIDEDGNKTTRGGGMENRLNVVKDDAGYLVVAYEKHMFYVKNELSIENVFVNETNTNVFQGYSSTITVPTSELLTNTLTTLGEDKRVELPAPSDEYEIWFGMDYYKNKPSHTTALIADTHPRDYAKVLEDNGFTVIRSFEDQFYSIYGQDGGYWYCYNEQEDLEILLSSVHYMYIDNNGKSYGTYQNTQAYFYHMRKGYFGEKEQTTASEWDSYDLEKMAEWYDGTIDGASVPFIKLSKGYGIPTTMSPAHSGFLDGTLYVDQQCYSITDESPRYFLDGYDEILEANGFHKYVPEYDLSIPAERLKFFNTEECKYVDCFINWDKDMAIKYYFDVTFGNTIRVFKVSEMKSWMYTK